MVKHIFIKAYTIYVGMFDNGTNFRDINNWEVFGKSFQFSKESPLGAFK